MTLTDFIDMWFAHRTPVFVAEYKHLDDVLDQVESDGVLPREFIDFCFNPYWSQWKSKVYLKDKWAFGEVQAFVTRKDGMVVFVEPKE